MIGRHVVRWRAPEGTLWRGADWWSMDKRSGRTALAASPATSHWAERPRRWARTTWTPAWLSRRPKPVRIAIRTMVIIILTLFAIWLILFITKGRFLKGPFERFATSQLER